MGIIIGSISTQVMCTMSQMADIVAEHTGKVPAGQTLGLMPEGPGRKFCQDGMLALVMLDRVCLRVALPQPRTA